MIFPQERTHLSVPLILDPGNLNLLPSHARRLLKEQIFERVDKGKREGESTGSEASEAEINTMRRVSLDNLYGRREGTGKGDMEERAGLYTL